MAKRKSAIARPKRRTFRQDLPHTPERAQHGPVEPVEQAIADEDGRPSRPYRTFDTLALMERRGSISPEMRQAGEDFRARFTIARLDPLKAKDLAKPYVQGRATNPGDLRVEGAREAVWRALCAVGGLASPAGSCVWHVVGWERSLREWALEQGWSGRRVSQETASGILIAGLGVLAKFYGLDRS